MTNPEQDIKLLAVTEYIVLSDDSKRMKQQIKNNIMNTHESTLKRTNLWVILNEENFSIVKKNGEAMKFKTEEEADRFASSILHLWIAVNINFLDKFWKHKPSHDQDGGLLAEVGREIPQEWISDDEKAKRNPNKFKK